MNLHLTSLGYLVPSLLRTFNTPNRWPFSSASPPLSVFYRLPLQAHVFAKAGRVLVR